MDRNTESTHSFFDSLAGEVHRMAENALKKSTCRCAAAATTHRSTIFHQLESRNLLDRVIRRQSSLNNIQPAAC